MNNLRYAFRTLLKNPGFTAIAVCSLALAIGANIAVFSLLNAVILRPLPVHEPDCLRVLNWSGLMPKDYYIAGDEALFFWKGESAIGDFSYPVYCLLRDQAKGTVFAFAPTDPLTSVVHNEASLNAGLLVSGNFFAQYGAGPYLGRPITPADDRPEAEPVAVITHRWWERHYGMDRGVIGQTLTLNRTAFTIIGVLPRDFAGPLAGDAADIYLPLAHQRLFRPDFQLASPNHYWLQLMLRLPAAGSEPKMRIELDTVFRRHQQALSEPNAAPPALRFKAGRCGPWMRRQVIAHPLETLTWIVALVLLIACANVAGLLLARNAARQHEMAVRSALGAGRWQLLQPVLAESVWLAMVSTSLGWLLAVWGNGFLLRLLPTFGNSGHFEAHTDTKVIAFILGAMAATFLLTGVLPALVAAQIRPLVGLQQSRTLSAPRQRLERWLVIAQVAMSLVLVAGTGLMVRTLVNLRRLDLGFDSNRLLVFRLNAAQGNYSDSQWNAFYERVREAMMAIPGVQSVAFSDQSHIGAGFGTAYGIKIPGRESQSLSTSGMLVSDEFMATLRIPLLMGRGFNRGDTPVSGRVTVVNRAFADKMFPGEPPLGKFFKLGDHEYQIVGVCGNARLYDHRNPIVPIAYLSYRQSPSREAWFEIRTVVPSLALAQTVRQAVARLDRNLPVAGLTTQQDLANRLIAEEQMFATLGGALGLLALLLSCLGIYGLIAHKVARRTREIGIRMALGASPGHIARRELGAAVRLAVAGAFFGVPLTLAAIRILRHLLFGVSPHDPIILVLAVAVLVLVSVLAAWLPARRAARVEPLVALRCE
jgi:predicted permease